MKYIFLIALFLSFLIGFGILHANGQSYPDRPITIIVPTPPGGGQDILCRFLAEELKKSLRTDIIVVNKPGAGFTLGTDAVVKSKKDGYTLAYTNAPAIVHARVINPENVPYDPEKDLEPLGLHVFFPLPIAVQKTSPWGTFNELIEFAKNNPMKVRVGIPGIGSTSHLNFEIVNTLTGTQFTPIPFKGGQSSVIQLLGGHVDVIYDSIGNILPHVEKGDLKILLTTKKIPLFPEIPTLIDLGYKEDLFSGWHAFFAPAGIPEDVKKVLVPAIEKACKNPELIKRFEKMGYIIDYKSPEELKRLISEEYKRALKVALKLGLRK